MKIKSLLFGFGAIFGLILFIILLIFGLVFGAILLVILLILFLFGLKRKIAFYRNSEESKKQKDKKQKNYIDVEYEVKE